MIHVHIERLILDGVPLGAEERPTLQAAVERELGGLLAAGGIADGLHAGGAVEAVRGGPMELGGGGPVAGKIARAVYGGIGK